eukprot:4042430-Alexandrium_andersonii.AAC.1
MGYRPLGNWTAKPMQTRPGHAPTTSALVQGHWPHKLSGCLGPLRTPAVLGTSETARIPFREPRHEPQNDRGTLRA